MGTASLRRRLDIPVVVGLASMHILAIGACFPCFFSWSGVAIAVVLYFLTALGVTLCLHRLLTHGSFKTYRWFRCVLVLIATLAWEGRVLLWVGRHTIHHWFADKEGDPHSPEDGPWWAHVLWLMVENLVRDEKALLVVPKNLREDRTILFIDRLFWLPQVVLAIVLFVAGTLIGGWYLGGSWFFWGVCVRTTFVYNFTWSVNSLAHMYGYRNWNTTDKSRNNWFVALVTLGEGWHNNHHAQPKSAMHGMRWWEFDFTYRVIQFLSLIGLAWDIKKADTNFPEEILPV